MCTFKICVYDYNKRRDGKYPVSIRVCWKRRYAYIRTEYYVTTKQLTREFQLKDPFLIRELQNRIARYEEVKVTKLKQKIQLYNVKELARFFVQHSEENQNQNLDFISFVKEIANKAIGKGTSDMYLNVMRSLNSFNNSESLPVVDISVKYLQAYENWLRDKHLLSSSINLYMRTFKALFNKMRDCYNDEEKNDIPIPANPFNKYKLPIFPATKKRALSVNQIRSIRDIQLKLRRDVMARDVFMLSFYLAGMNSVDMYYADKYQDERITYNRQKTKGRRMDQAFISIKVEPETKILVNKYTGKTQVFCFSEMYHSAQTFNQNINRALKRVGNMMEIPGLTFYAARHSFASIARNDCGISKWDIHEALGHSDPEMRITDIYLKKDWSVVDNVVRKVLDVIK